MEDDVNNNIPEYGAIFMSSSLTKKECFNRHVFALPSSKANFVNHVKTGMILFLFEFDKRKLYGVFQATCDGTMDIVPNGFRYSGRRFPAQVCFKPIWFCHPLNEKEFKDAIRENYFSANKFKFGLSEFQVRRLLSLFNSKKVNKNPNYRLPEHVKDLAYVGDDGFKLSDRGFMENDEYKLSNYQMDLFVRARERELMKLDGIVYSVARDSCNDSFLTKKRWLDYQDRLSRDLAEIENYVVPRSLCVSSPIEVRRSVDCQRLVSIDRNYNENQVDELFNPVDKYPTELLEARTSDYDQYMQRNRFFRDSNNLGDGSNDHYSNVLNDYEIEGNVLMNDDGLLPDCNSFGRVKSLVYSDRDFNIVARVMNRRDNHQRLLNEQLESRYQVCDDGCTVTASEPFTSRLHRARRSSAGGMFPDNNRIEGEQGIVTPITGSSSENFPCPSDIERRTYYDRKLRLAEGGVTYKIFDTGLSSTAYRSSGREENVDDVNTCAGYAMSKYCPSFSKPQHIFSSSEKPLLETRIISTRPSVSQNHLSSSSTFDDPTTAIAADPFICELPKAAQRCPVSEVADWNSSFGQHSHPYSLPMSSASQFLSEPFRCSPLSKSFNPNLSRHRVPHTYTLVDENLFSTNGQLQTATQYVSDHSTCKNHMESKEDIICFETKNISQVAAYSPTTIGLSSKDHLKVSDASSHSVPNSTRRSVFSRLAPANKAQVGEDINDAGFDYFDHCMDASADEVMEMLLPGNNLPLRMISDPKVVAQPMKPVKFDLNKKQMQCDTDLISHSTAEEKDLNDSFLSNEESVDEVPKESRVVDFKRRSTKKRSWVGTTNESATDITVTTPKVEAGNPTRKTTRHKKLVRPLFGKTESASTIIGSDTAASKVLELTHVGDDKQNCQKSISNDKPEWQIDNASLSGYESPHEKKNNHSEEQKDLGLGVENRSLQANCVGGDKQNCPKGISNDKSEVQNDDANGHSEEQKDLEVQSCSLQMTHVGDSKQNCQKSIKNVQTDVSLSSYEPSYDKKNDHSEEQKDIGVENCSLLVTSVADEKQNVQKSISNDKGEEQNGDASLGSHESPHDKKNDHSEEQKALGVENCSLQVQHEKITREQNCSLENSAILLPKEVDSTVESLKHEEPSLEKLKPDASSSNSREGKKVRLGYRIVKKIVKIRKVRPGILKTRKVSKENCENSQGQNFEKDKPSSENLQGKSEAGSIMNNHVP